MKIPLSRTPVLVALLVLLGGVAQASDPISPPAGGTDVVTFAEGEPLRLDTGKSGADTEWVSIPDMPFDKAYRVNVTPRSDLTPQVQLDISTQESIDRGNAVLLSFWIRRPKSGGEPAPSVIYVQAGRGKKRYEFKFQAYREWQQHVRAFAAPANFSLAKSNVSLRVSNPGPALDVADVRLLDYGPDVDIATLPESAVTYQGREPDAQWRKDALARIEQIRKGDFTIEVVDAQGNPVPDAKVNVQMQRHAFGFGNVVNSQLLGGDESAFPYTKNRSGVKKVSTWQDAQKYREIVKDYFNVVTFESELRPHVWSVMASDTRRGKNMQKVFSEQAVPWLQSHDIGIRGHYIAWGAIDYNANEKKFIGKPDAHRQWLWGHMADVLPKTSDYVTEWDTINHIIAWGKHTYEIEYGGFDIYAEIMKEARRLAPDAKHSINEGKVLPDGYKREPYKRVIRFLNDQGQPPDTVGFMAHFGLTSLTPPEELLAVYDDFAEIAPRMQLSELDVEAGDDEQLQADFYRDVMIASFSHPNFVSIVQWGFWENAHWKPAAALWRADWSLKPAGEVFVDLVKNQWWTDEAVQTNAQGKCQVRGFLGDYTIRVDHEGQTASKATTLEHAGTRLQIQIP